MLLPLAIGCSDGLRRSPPAVDSQPGEPPVPTYHLKRLSSLPELSGRINSSFWRGIPELGRMTLVGLPGQPIAYTTRAKACWDDHAIRILWHCRDDSVHARYRNRDDPLYVDDVVEVFPDPEGDLTRYFELVFNPHGTLFDAAIFNPTLKRGPEFEYNHAWNCHGIRWKAIGRGWFNGTDSQDRWWAVEAEIPFAGLGRPTPAAGETWRVGVYRIEKTNPVQWYSWTAMYEGKYGLHQSDRFGQWIFEE